MRPIAIAFMSLLMILSTGCLQSVQPFYKDGQVIAPGELVGTWVDPEKENNTLIVTANADGKSCAVEYKDGDNRKLHRFDVHIARLGEKTIADFVVQAPENEKPADAPAEPHHQFVIVEVKDHDRLLVSALDYNWFKKFIEENPDALKHEKTDSDQYLLTGTTDEIQAFVLKHLDTPGAFGEPGEFRRGDDDQADEGLR